MGLSQHNIAQEVEFAVKWGKRIADPKISLGIRANMCRHMRDILKKEPNARHLVSVNIFIQAEGNRIVATLQRNAVNQYSL